MVGLKLSAICDLQASLVASEATSKSRDGEIHGMNSREKRSRDCRATKIELSQE